MDDVVFVLQDQAYKKNDRKRESRNKPQDAHGGAHLRAIQDGKPAMDVDRNPIGLQLSNERTAARDDDMYLVSLAGEQAEHAFEATTGTVYVCCVADRKNPHLALLVRVPRRSLLHHQPAGHLPVPSCFGATGQEKCVLVNIQVAGGLGLSVSILTAAATDRHRRFGMRVRLPQNGTTGRAISEFQHHGSAPVSRRMG